MTEAQKLELARTVIAILIALAVLLWAIPGPCQCPDCAKHVHERGVEQERRRAQSHRAVHSMYPVKWGDKRCGQCASGHEDDRDVDS